MRMSNTPSMGEAGATDSDAPSLQALPLRPLEAATGLALGSDDVATFTVTRSAVPPLEALVTVMTELVREGPTYVSFSGGRDSSGVLAAGVVAARGARECLIRSRSHNASQR